MEKQHILSAEKLFEESPEQAKEELDHIPEIDYFRMSPKWQARYINLQCRIADQIETEFPLAIEINTVREWYIKKGKTNEIVALSQFLGRAYMKEKDNQLAIKAFLYGLDWATKAGLINEAGYLNSYLADVYIQNNHIETALAKYKEAADCFLQAGNLRSYGFAQRDMGFSYEMLELYNDALVVTAKADSIGRLLNDTIIRSSALNGFGNIYLSMGEYDRAIGYLLESQQVGSISLHGQMALSEAYIEAGQFTKARQILDGMSQDSIPEMFKRGVYYYYYKIHSKEGNDKEALYNFEQFYHLIEKRLDELEDYNYIEAEKKYNHLNLTVQVKELTFGKQRSLLFISLLILLVLILTVIYLYRQMITNKQLVNQEKQINESQRKIVNLTRELEKKRKESLLMSGDQLKQKEQDIQQLKSSLLQTRENIIRLSPLRKRLMNKIKNFKSSDNASIDTDMQTQMELEVDMIYPDLIIYLNKQYPTLTESDLQYCVLCLYEFDLKQEAILLGIDTGSVSKRRTRISKRLQTSFKENNLVAFLKNCSLNLK